MPANDTLSSVPIRPAMLEARPRNEMSSGNHNSTTAIVENVFPVMLLVYLFLFVTVVRMGERAQDRMSRDLPNRKQDDAPLH